MKPEFKIFVSDPAKLKKEENELYKAICQFIAKRHSESKLSNSSQRFIVYVFINHGNIPSSIECIVNKMYFCDRLDSDDPISALSFSSTLKAGLKSHIHIPDNIQNVIICLSNKEISESDLFPPISEEKPITFTPIDPIFSLDDVIMNDDERIAIYQALAIIEHKELVFDKWNYKSTDKSTKSILCFHGAPGTGKTMCAHGVAKYLGKKLILGSYNEIQSKYVGEGVKNLKACFEAAEEQDAVLFIDEADTFLSKRLPGSNENSKIYNSMSNELFQFVETFNGCLIFASNHIEDFDPAIISRIIQPIEFRLPDTKARVEIIKKLLPKEAPIILTEEQMGYLAAISEGFSGRDIRKAVLLLMASAAYKYKTIQNLPDDTIEMTFDDACSSFKQVKTEKEKLKNSGKAKRVLTEKILEEQKRNERLLNCAANAVWADGQIIEKERILFDELCSIYNVSINLMDKSSITPIETICGCVLSKAEKIQLLDISVRIAAIDGMYEKEEMEFIHHLSGLLGFKSERINQLDDYIQTLMTVNQVWLDLVKDFNLTDYDIIKDLKREYTESAAYYHLGKMYQEGSVLYGGINVDLNKANEYFEKANELGYLNN